MPMDDGLIARPHPLKQFGARTEESARRKVTHYVSSSNRVRSRRPSHYTLRKFRKRTYFWGSRVSSGSIVSDYGLDDRAIEVNPRQGQRIFPLSSVSRPALGPTQPPVQWVPEVLSPGLKRGRGVALTTHPHLVPRCRMSRSYTPLPPSAFMACSGTALAVVYCKLRK
jgi:hypothetical protein